jgi:hypothetical protein
VGISNARTSVYQAEKSPTTTVFSQALSAGVSASQTAGKDCIAAISQEVKPPNSASPIPFQATIDSVFHHLKICNLQQLVSHTRESLILATSRV